MSAHLYRVFDAAEQLLYVGCTVNLESRLAQHARHAPWWSYHEFISSEVYPTRAEAEAAEARAIAEEHPRWNRAGRTTPAPDLAYERELVKRVDRLTRLERELVSELRQVRMGLAGARAEVTAVKNGLDLGADDAA